MGGVASWGRYPSYPQSAEPLHWQEEIGGVLARHAAAGRSTLAYGSGLSYGDSCLATSDRVLATRPLDRFISADWQNGVVTAEAGVTLEELLELAIPQGWFLPVTPGTKYATLGGALANDVHGKNHHVCGTLGCHVTRFGLARSDRSPMECSRDRNADLFAATIGGLGLTGVIEWIEVRLRPIRSALIDATYERFDSLSEFFALSDELDHRHEYTVAWIDCVARGRDVGRGVYMTGDHAAEGGLLPDRRRKLRIPFTPPVSVVNALSLRLFNAMYYRAHPRRRVERPVGYDQFFYPLDRILEWNRIYGPRGFQQYQCVIPHDAAEAAMRELLGAIAAEGRGSFLAVLKRCGDAVSPGLLSFPMPGVSLALDFPQENELNARLFPRLDTIVREAGGRLYPAKDAHMSGEDFRAAYPAWEQVEALRDPVLCSRFWQRVTAS